MKKFISMVMAAAMVVSLVPATAFAAENAVRVADKIEWTEKGLTSSHTSFENLLSLIICRD